MLTIILAVLFFAISTTSQKTLTYQDKTFIYNLSIIGTLSADTVTADCFVKSISIVRRSDNKIVQTILPLENFLSCSFPKDQILILEDMNFDGSNDLRIIHFIPAGPNVSYYYWTFNNKLGQFREDTALEEITSPEFNHAQKLITSFWRSSCCDHGLSTYRYIKGKPVLIEEVETAMDLNDNSKYITTVKKRIGGKLKLVKKTIESAEKNNEH